MARQLRVDVIELASTVPHAQRPAYYDGVVGKFCLAGCEGVAEGPKRAEPSTEEHRISTAAITWEKLRSSTNLADLEAFAARYRDLYFAGLAKARIDELKKQPAVVAKSEADAAQQAANKKAEDDARAKEEAERKRLAMLQQDDERKRAEAEAAKKRAEAPGTMQPGAVFRDCPECPEMVVVPAGDFMMGSPTSEEGRSLLNTSAIWFRQMMGSPESEEGRSAEEGRSGEEGRSADESPRHRVTIAKPFAVGKFAVTFTEWAACGTGGGCAGNRNPKDEGWGRGKRPVINVSWDDATQYLAWLSKKSGKSYRLLTEAEWEYAARGVTMASAPHTPFSAGATISTDQANYDGNYTYGSGEKGVGVFRRKTVEVGSFPANAFGLHDMHGNVYQWVQDCYKDSYSGAPTDRSAVASTDCGLRVLRGGSWFDVPLNLRSASRSRRQPDIRDNRAGFRVARTL